MNYIKADNQNNMQVIKINQTEFFTIPRDLAETDESYYLRCWFIIKKLKSKLAEINLPEINLPEINLDEIIKLSRIIRNIKLYDCKYNKEIMKIIDTIELNNNL